MSYLKMISFAVIASMAVLGLGNYIQAGTTAPINDNLANEDIRWHTVSEIDLLQKNESKMIIVDVYTDWCKWCKAMDQKTFTDPALKQYLNEKFHLVKFNAEDKSKVTFKGQEHMYVPSGRRGYNTLAVELLQGSLSYPSFVVLDENLKLMKVIKGYKDAVSFKEALSTVAL